MPRTAAVAISNNFNGGVVTEATGLNFPENACTEAWNTIFHPTGEVDRRRGFDFETNYSTNTVSVAGKAFSEYLWRNVAGNGDLTYLVVQIGETLYFYNASDPVSLSVGLLVDTVDLTDFSPSGAPSPGLSECQFAAGTGRLFVTHRHLEAFSVSWTGSAIATDDISIEVRDLTGVADAIAVTTRPTATVGTATAAHLYNLYNQGWEAGPLATWDAGRSDLPSKADIMWSFKNASDVFDISTVASVYRGNSPAPKGHFILNLYSQQRDTASGFSVPDVTTGMERASTCAFFAGRVWYAGVNYTEYSGRVYFSQIVETSDQFGRCYQLNDPTSEDAFDLLPSDGGVIDILDAGQIFKVVPLQDSMIVFASNGVWSITGSANIGFAANDYTVRRVSSQPVLSAASFVDVGGMPVWWSTDGIQTLAVQEGGALTVQSLTDAKIKTFFLSIPPASKKFARGFFNTIEKTVQWLYRAVPASDLSETYEFDQVLVLNTLSGAFYPYSIDVSDVSIHGIVSVDSSGGGAALEDVLDGLGATVTANDTTDVQVYNSTGSLVVPVFKYLVSYGGNTVTFAEEYRSEYLDWLSYDAAGYDYTSHFISGYQIRGDAQRKFQASYVYIFSENAVDTSYLFQGIWNFGARGSSGKWSSRQLVTHTADDFSVKYRRLKVRGTGVSLQFKVTSIPGEPFALYGWSALETANSSV